MVSLWQWIKNQIVQSVPEEIALCEFDCCKTQCTEKEWQRCSRRIARAAGELMPFEKSKHWCVGDTVKDDLSCLKKIA